MVTFTLTYAELILCIASVIFGIYTIVALTIIFADMKKSFKIISIKTANRLYTAWYILAFTLIIVAQIIDKLNL